MKKLSWPNVSKLLADNLQGIKHNTIKCFIRKSVSLKIMYHTIKFLKNSKIVMNFLGAKTIVKKFMFYLNWTLSTHVLTIFFFLQFFFLESLSL